MIDFADNNSANGLAHGFANKGAGDSVTLSINGRPVSVAPDVSVAAAIAIAGSAVTRRSVGGAARAPLCGMGVCQECRVTIDGRAHELSCQTLCAEGMHVQTGALERVA